MTIQPNSDQVFLNLQKSQALAKPSCIVALLRAVAAGTLVGGGPFTVVTILVALDLGPSNDVLSRLTLAFAPIVIAVPLVLAGMLMIGLPTTRILRARRAERLKAYLAVGALGGVLFGLIATAFYGDSVGWEALGIFGAAGLVAGLTASFVWARHRMRLLSDANTPQPEPRTNPIHDLLF
ncbi:hypothetical protein [Aurantiacibacter marinus]|uniref:Uncharacterized protein n=1 Tax=Aurantiacibacter marinus TaxID=874156 RepID=A0A0H0XRE8_9SPHN|nr:hypothetical protein [Aurantiacibacter marinus]KLI64909.1 hypothetical protein AAV99_05255 [Aurantiacibacter marinus]